MTLSGFEHTIPALELSKAVHASDGRPLWSTKQHILYQQN
jgi:hypothetical protein